MHSRYVLGVLSRMHVDPADVEDVAQEVFLAVHEGLPKFEGRSQLRTWLVGICYRRAAEYRRKNGRRKRLWEARPVDPEPEVETPYEGAVRSELAGILFRALGQLPEEQREVFELHAIEGLAMNDVAALVGCPLNTAYTRFRVARERVVAYCRRALRLLEET